MDQICLRCSQGMKAIHPTLHFSFIHIPRNSHTPFLLLPYAPSQLPSMFHALPISHSHFSHLPVYAIAHISTGFQQGSRCPQSDPLHPTHKGSSQEGHCSCPDPASIPIPTHHPTLLHSLARTASWCVMQTPTQAHPPSLVFHNEIIQFEHAPLFDHRRAEGDVHRHANCMERDTDTSPHNCYSFAPFTPTQRVSSRTNGSDVPSALNSLQQIQDGRAAHNSSADSCRMQ